MLGKNGQACLTEGTDGSGGGSGYFSSPSWNIFASAPNSQIIGGFGGLCYFGLGFYKDVSGNGGKSGAGGVIKYSKQENIYAYNGNMVTDKTENTAKFYEYNVTVNGDDLTSNTIETKNILNTFTRKDERIIIPIKIFSQSGIIRETYTTNQGKFTLDKVKRKLEKGEVLPEIAKNGYDVVAVRATNLIKITTSNYANGYYSNQGIGSRSPDI